MKQENVLKGILLLLVTTISWGTMFPIAKAALSSLDGFYLSALRYGFASLIFLAILLAVEGASALKLEGEFAKVYFFGSMGFAGFSILAFVGLSYSRPEHGAIIMALMPFITAVMNWTIKGIRPNGATLGCIAAALAGVFLVITKGDAEVLLHGGSMFGDILIFLGAVCWVTYTIGAGYLPGWSPLRYTTLSATLGTGTILLATAAATVAGYVQTPSLETIMAVRWELAYLVVIAAVMAVFSWNVGIKILGPLNGVLFINLVPITAFAIAIARGISFSPVEFLGAGITIIALVVNNMNSRGFFNRLFPVRAPLAPAPQTPRSR